MNQKDCTNVNFSEGLGIFDNHYGYPILDQQEQYNGPTGKVVDIQGPQAHAGRNFFVPEGNEFSFDIDECPYLHIAIKAEENTNTCLFLCAHDKEPREHIRRFVVIGKTPEGDHGIYDIIKDFFTIKADGTWHEYDFDLRMIRETQDGEYPCYPDAGSVSIIQFYSWSGTGEHTFYFNELLSQDSQPPISEHSEPGTLEEMLKKRLPEETPRLDATRIWLESRRNPEQFLTRIKGNSKLESQADAICFTLEIADRVGGYPKVIRAMEQGFDAGEFREASQIAEWEESKWEQLIRKENIEVPDSFTKDDSNASVRAFANHLRTTFERAYPKQAIRAHFDRHADSYPWGKSVRDILNTEKSLDPSKPVVSLEREHPELFKDEEGKDKETRRGLATFQRLHRLTKSIDPIQSLVSAGLDSATAIAHIDPAEFANRFASAFGGSVNEAATMHARAIHASSVAKLTYSTLSDQFNTTPFAALGSPKLSDKQSQTPSTWSDIFGSQDLGFCECAHCKSIFGPAAYLFDMLLFLDRFTVISQQLGSGYRITPLEFLNCVYKPEHIVNWVQDDSDFPIGSENTIGVSLEVATKILQKRKALGGRFSIMHQIYDVNGVGPNILHDIIYTSWGEAGPIAIELALEFLNSVSEAREIKYRIKRDPEYRIKHHPEYGTWDPFIPLWVAEQILDHRDIIEVGGTYTSLSQVADVPCVGPDTLHNIIYSFYAKADQQVTADQQVPDVDWRNIGPTDKMVALAEFNGRLFGATSDLKLLIRDAIPEDLPWHLIGFIDNVKALSFFNGKLFAATDNNIRMWDPSKWLTTWDEIGHSWYVVGLTAMSGKLYAATSRNMLQYWDSTYNTWRRIGEANNVVGLTAMNGLFYAVTSDNWLLMGKRTSSGLSWTKIKHFNGVVVGMTAMDKNLYVVLSNNSLYKGIFRRSYYYPYPIIPTAIDWLLIGHANDNDVVALAAAGGFIFIATSDDKLLMREATYTRQPWIHIGTAENIVDITIMSDMFYAATLKGKLLIERPPPRDVLWTDIANIKDIAAMTVYNNTLYVVSNGRLLTRNFASLEAPWIDIGHADQVIAMTSQECRLVAATKNNRLLTRIITQSEAPWTDMGPAKGAVAMAATNDVLYAVNGNNELWMGKLPQVTLLENLRQRRPDVPALLLSCDNTNIEVPHIDLVNELLVDLIFGSICFNIYQSAASFSARSTTGTSEERRAWPEHDPPEPVLTELEKATRPWMLPYDYDRDRAEQARQALPMNGNEVVEAVWRFETIPETEGATSPQTHAWSLAQHALHLNEAEVELITSTAPDLKSTWGDEVASALASSQSPTVAALQRAGQFDFAALEDALETRFVRQATTAESIEILTENTCDPEQLHLKALDKDLPAILDRLHRFERLRRKCNWSAHQLDDVLAMLHQSLGKNELLIIGLLVHLQQRLQVGPDTILGLFQNPSSEKPFTLRSDKHVLSSFERLFGTEPLILPARTGDAAADVNASDVVVATIAARVGIGPDEVRFVFSKGYAGIDGTTFVDPLEILKTSDPLTAWRSAVAGVFRVTAFAEALGLSLADFIALVELSNTVPLLKPNTGGTLKQQLIDAVSLVGLAHETGNWPLSASEVLYLATTDAFTSRVHAPDAVQSGNLLKKIQNEVQRVSEAFQTTGETTVTTVQQALLELFSEALHYRHGGQSVQKTIDRIHSMIEWSSVFPKLKAQIIASLPANAVLETEVQYPDKLEKEAEKALSEVLDIKKKESVLPELFRRHLTQVSGGIHIDESDSKYQSVLQSVLQTLLDETKAAIRDQRPANVASLSEKIQPLLTLMNVPDEERKAKSEALASTVLAAVIQTVSSRMESVRMNTAQHWLPALTASVRRSKVDTVVIELLANAFSLDTADASHLLHHLLRDPDHDQALIRAFISRDGSTKQVDASLVQASYLNLEEVSSASSTDVAAPSTSTPSEVQFAATRVEPSLQLDWVASPPPAGINPKRFQVTLSASVTTGSLKTDSGIRRLVVESIGAVTMSLDAGTHKSQVLELNAAGRLQKQEWDTSEVAKFLNTSTQDSDTEVRMELTFTTVPEVAGEGETPISAPRVLRVLIAADDGELVPLATGTLTNALVHLDKAARLVRGLSLPPAIWSMLATLPNGRRIDLNDLPITSGHSFDLWQKVVSLEWIWKRNLDENDVATLQSIVTGSAVSVDVLMRSLGLTRTELRDLLQLLKIPFESEKKEVSLTSDWRSLEAALRLSDLAREAGLPLAAITGWITAPSRDFYRWGLGALRALGPEEEWLQVLAYINDPVRENLRNALMAWLVSHPRRDLNGMLHPPFAKPENISDYLLTDVQMSACMASSRVQFAYAAVQRFIDAIRLGFEPGPEDAESQERFEREWTWRRFYRLWEANRRVFAYPENWLEPDLRPDKTPFFQELEEELMEGPLTTQSAENALVSYLGKVVDVARPEIIGIIHESELPDKHSPLGFRDPDLQGTHVFGRSRSQPHQLYYRRRMPALDNRWTPWERIEAELPGTHFVPVIAFRRLYLICADFGIGKSFPDACDLKNASQSKEPSDIPQKSNLILSWIERRHGRWSSVQRSELLEFETPEVRVRQTGLNESFDNDFPSKSFPVIKWSIKDSAKINGVRIWITLGIVGEGIDHHMGQITEIHVTLIKKGRDKSIGTLKGKIKAKETVQVWESFSPIDASEIKGIRLDYHSRQPGAGEGDVCNITKVKWRFSNTKGNQFTGEIEEADDKKGLVIFMHSNNSWTHTFSVDTTIKEKELKWEDVREYFEVEIAAEYSPRDAYALHIELPNVQTSGPLRLHLVLNDGAKLRIAGTPKFRFVGFPNFPEELRPPEELRDWPDDWIASKEPQSQCIEGTIQFDRLTTIEMFSDGTVRNVQTIANSTLSRGNYKGTSPWRQRFRRKRNPALDSTTEILYFYTDEEPVLSLENSYDLIVQNQGEISSLTSPKVLDEFSDLSDGLTLFVDAISGTRMHLRPWLFRIFWHPQAVGFLRLLQAYGAPRLLSHAAQKLVDPKLSIEQQFVSFFDDIKLDNAYLEPPGADVDFSLKGAYSDYNWELFFHAPLLIAQRLSEAGQFEEADRWFRLLFDPAMGRLNTNPQEAFQTRPLREAVEQRLEDMLLLLNDDQEIRKKFAEQVDLLNRFPYQPHLIARSRWSAYKKTLVMKYLDHLIAWGDELFRRAYATDNRTDLENAGSRYDLVAKLLGKRPEVLPSQSKDSIFSFDALLREDKDILDLWDPLVRIEDYVHDSNIDKLMPSIFSMSDRIEDIVHDSNIDEGTGMSVVVPNDGEGIPEYLYFCVPHNDQLFKYWDDLADRLANLRTCRDIEGVRRTLSLYGRRIDPGLLVRATAKGLDIDILLGYLSAPIPRFRFNVLLQRARSACDRAHTFGQALLTAIEKRESEELVRLRSRHELTLLQASKRVRDEQVKEAKESLEALWKSLESAEVRHQFYSTRQRLNVKETAENEALDKAAQNEQLAIGASASAADLAFVPNIPVNITGGYRYPPNSGFFEASAGVNYDFGGQFLSKLEERKAMGHRHAAEYQRVEAGRLGRQGQHDRRWDDWQLQKDLAEKDMEQIDKQIVSAEIRLSIAEIEQENQLLQIDQTATVDAYLRDKFTNAKLYRWMESRLSRLYYQQYRLAYDSALKAQRALIYELGFEDDSLLPDTWDPSRRGMEAAADLLHELEKLETRYLDAWRREHEKQKTFSLADRRPLEFLELRQTGSCVIRILEHEFDEDEPGDYFRRIKQVSVSIPCIVGPDISVNARLTLLRSEVRAKPFSSGQRYERAEGPDGANDDRFRDYSGGAEHIVTSTGVNDTGQFDSSLGGDRILPFEGAGVISTWQIDLPRETNNFDRASLADVKLRILYTARDGGEAARIAALAARDAYLERKGREVLIPLASCYSNSWIRFTGEKTAPRELELKFSSEHLPFALQNSELVGVNLYFEVEEGALVLDDSITGTLDQPHDLRGLVRFTPKAPVRRDDPLRLTLASDSAIPRRGWAVLIVKPTAGIRERER